MSCRDPGGTQHPREAAGMSSTPQGLVRSFLGFGGNLSKLHGSLYKQGSQPLTLRFLNRQVWGRAETLPFQQICSWSSFLAFRSNGFSGMSCVIEW